MRKFILVSVCLLMFMNLIICFMMIVIIVLMNGEIFCVGYGLESIVQILFVFDFFLLFFFNLRVVYIWIVEYLNGIWIWGIGFLD